MLVVVDLNRCVDAQRYRHFFGFAIGSVNHHRDVLPRLDPLFKSDDVKRLGAIKFERLRVCAFLKLARQHAHANQVAAVYALEALRHDGAHA